MGLRELGLWGMGEMGECHGASFLIGGEHRMRVTSGGGMVKSRAREDWGEGVVRSDY